MPRLSRNLLILAAVFWVAPVSAEQRVGAAQAPGHQPSGCPYAQAKAAAAAERANASTASSIGSSDSVPADGSFFRRQAQDFLP
jgi:hypothetical protein